MTKLPLSVAMGDYDRTRPLVDGRAMAVKNLLRENDIEIVGRQRLREAVDLVLPLAARP